VCFVCVTAFIDFIKNSLISPTKLLYTLIEDFYIKQFIRNCNRNSDDDQISIHIQEI
jgi:hypothetical protein